jgi:hypothetical protein
MVAANSSAELSPKFGARLGSARLTFSTSPGRLTADSLAEKTVIR